MSGDKLPEPLVPAEVDSSGMPLPLDFFVELAMSQWGGPREYWQNLVEEVFCQGRGPGRA